MPAINHTAEMDIDFSDLEAKYAVQPVKTVFDTIVVVDNAPIVDATKEEKLLGVIRKIFKPVGNIVSIRMPKDEAGKSKGFMFVEFSHRQEAELAIKTAHGYKMDKVHILSVFLFDDVETFATMDDEYVERIIEPFEPKEHLKGWLTDSRARDQFAMMKGDDVGIYWNNKGEMPDKVVSKANWTDMYVSWSPKGSYMLTSHAQGIALWGGASWKKLVRFAHPNVKMVDFSPDEKYMVTWSHEHFTTPDKLDHNIVVWEVITGRLLRSFAVDAPTNSAAKVDWPMFKWSSDSKYVAKMTTGEAGMISVYEVPGMGLLDKKSIKVENIQSFEWSPAEPILSFWTPESGQIPARVTLMKVPSREIVRTKNLFSVVDVKLAWQSLGEYLLIQVERTKSKTKTTFSAEVFKVKQKDIPVDVLDLGFADSISSVTWEPKGNRFVFLCTENERPFAKIYQIESSTTTATDIKRIKSADAKGINQVSWSPHGRFLVLASIRNQQGELQFWDMEEIVHLATGDHYMCTDIEWDPTGRYLVSSVSYWRVQTDTGFAIWTCTGQQLAKQNVPGFKQFQWRPRPETLLTLADQKKIKKKLKDYSKDFEEEDSRLSNMASSEVQERRRALWKEWKDFKTRCQTKYESEKETRFNLYGYDPDEATSHAHTQELEEWIEEVVEEKEEILQ